MTPILIIVGIVALVWGTILVARGSLSGGCLAFLVVGCCFGNCFWTRDIGSATITLDRLFLVGLLVAYTVQWRSGRTDPKPITGTDILLGALLIALVSNALIHAWSATNSDGVPPLWRLFSGYLMPAMIYWIARQSPLTQRRLKVLLAGLVAFGVYLAVTGLLEVAQQWALVFPRHIADPNLGLHFGRARGPMLQSVSFGLYVSICMFSAWLLRQQLGRFGQLVMLGLIPLFLAGAYFSYTRSVWIGTAVGLFLISSLTLPPVWRKLVPIGMLVAGLLLAVTQFDSLMGFQREYSAANTRDSAYMRASFTYVSWQMFLDRPIVGCGFGHFADAKLPYLSDRSTDLHLEAIRDLGHHNTLLSLLTETGLVGVGLFLALVYAWTRNAWLMYRNPETPAWVRVWPVLLISSIGVYFCQWMFHELSYAPIDHALLFLIAGVTVGLRPHVKIHPYAEPLPEYCRRS